MDLDRVRGTLPDSLGIGAGAVAADDLNAVVDAMPEVCESLVIGAEPGNGRYWMPLFIVPDDVIAVRGIAHTRTGKKLEVPIERLLQKAPCSHGPGPRNC